MKRIKRKELDNGLVVLTEKMPHRKKAVLLVGIKVGAVNENDKLSGASHFTEHLLFKSNKFRSAKQINEDLEFEGILINAFTDQTMTFFYADSIPAKLGKAIDIIYEAVTNFEYDQKEFELERKVVLTEIQVYIEQPMDYSSENLFIPTLFRGTPLERTIAGTEKSIGGVTKEELKQFKRAFYVPNNMAIVLVGNFNEKELEKRIENTFANLKPKSLPSQYLDIDLTNQYFVRLESHPSIKEIYLDIGFKVPGFAHEDVFKLMLLDGILSAGSSSRMFQRLREERGIGYSVGSSFGNFGNAGAFETYVAGFDVKRFEEVKDVILKEFRDLKINLVSSRELDGTKNLLIAEHHDVLERLFPRADSILEKEFDKFPFDFRELPRHLKKISRKDILEIARKYLTDQFVLTALVPEGFKKLGKIKSF